MQLVKAIGRQLDESDLSLPGFGTGMTVDVCQLLGKLPEYQMSRKDVPFWGLKYLISTFDPYLSPKYQILPPK